MRPPLTRALAGLAAIFALALASAAPAGARGALHTAALRDMAPVAASKTFVSPRAVTHLAVYWLGNRNATVRVAMSRDGRHFGRPRTVQLDDGSPPGPRTYGSVMLAYGVRAARVYTDRPLRRLTVLWMADRGRPMKATAHSAATVSQPKVIPRVDWGADESLRYDSTGKEVWPPAFYPVQKLIVHHTDTQNNDPDPAATVRSIYYYHAVTEGWGDIGYNFLIDEQGRIYEGRHTFDYPSGSSPTEEDANGNGVTAAHVQGFNSGTVGIALLGTLTSQDALNDYIAGIGDPQGSSLYTNPVSGTQKTFPNIAGHRDVNATECPGGVFYATLPTIRSDVAAMLSSSPPPPPSPDFTISASPSSQSVVRGRSVTYTITVRPSNGFAGSVTLSASRLPSGASATFSPNPASSTSTMTVRTSSSSPTGTDTLSISGTSGTLTHTASATLQVRKR